MKGDLNRSETLDAAFAGVDKVFLVCVGGDMATLAGNAVAAAKKAGVKHLVFLSSGTAGGEKETIIGRWHHDAEAVIEGSGIAWTMLRPGAFSSNTLQWIGSLKAKGAVFLPTGDRQERAPSIRTTSRPWRCTCSPPRATRARRTS